MHVRTFKLAKKNSGGFTHRPPLNRGGNGNGGKGRCKGKERRGKGKDRRHDGRKREEGWGIGMAGFVPLLLKADRRH